VILDSADTLTLTSITTMPQDSDLLELVERWSGIVGGAPDEQSRSQMRRRTWDTLRDFIRAAGFRTVSWVDPTVLGARSDRLVAFALR